MPEPAVIVSPRVLVIVYNPVMDPATGKKLSQVMNWSRAEDLSAQFVADILQAAAWRVIKSSNVSKSTNSPLKQMDSDTRPKHIWM
jgi:hypothetical protein